MAETLTENRTQRHFADSPELKFGSANPANRVAPSIVGPDEARPFTLEQELTPFGTWASDPIWVPPKNSSNGLAETMLEHSGLFTPREELWEPVVEEHRSEFTHVREIDLTKASIRLPKGKFFVSVLEQDHFDEITDKVPACVQTRLEEFMAGPGKKPGVKIYYLKPLCVEVDDKLILTNREAIDTAIEKIQEEVYEEYRDLYLTHLPGQIAKGAADIALAIPRRFTKLLADRKQRAIDAFEARLEFQRRKIALRAAKAHRRCRTEGCTFEDMLTLTEPMRRKEVVELYSIDQQLSPKKRDRLLRIAAGSLPWFVTLSFGAGIASAASSMFAVTVTVAPPLVVCDPAFVAEMPDDPGVLLKIGHFDEVAGVTHVEILIACLLFERAPACFLLGGFEAAMASCQRIEISFASKSRWPLLRVFCRVTGWRPALARLSWLQTRTPAAYSIL